MARLLGWSQAGYWRFEHGLRRPTMVEIAEVGALLGLELSAGLHPIGDPVNDSAQLKLSARFRGLLADTWLARSEMLLPGAFGQRAWDYRLRLEGEIDGVDLESRFRDIQALVRRTRLRERDGGVTHILIVGADTAHNRRYADELREALGSEYSTSARDIVTALRSGRPLPGSGVILI